MPTLYVIQEFNPWLLFLFGNYLCPLKDTTVCVYIAYLRAVVCQWVQNTQNVFRVYINNGFLHI